MTPASEIRYTRAPDERVSWVKSIPFVLVHLVAIATPFITGLHWQWIVLALASYYVRMIAITMGYHRYFSHRSFKTSRAFQLVLAVVSSSSVQKGVLWWAANHRHHHKYSDQPDDVHSPRKGFWWSHVGWILSKKYEDVDYDKIKDFARYPELRWLDRNYLVVPILVAFGFFLAGGWPALLWGFFVSTVLLWHGTFTVNSLAHVFGKRRYETTDTSRNSVLIALMTSGEGWHNNHHHYQSTANQGWFWWEIDTTWYVLKLLALVGVVWDLRTPPEHVKARTKASSTAPGSDRTPVEPAASPTAATA